MLKALELFGFKSFADKTRFEFPRGITVIVGPNGSGKSNVVDAIKWVLGEQSVKSLRGKEMADVIFNGSGSRKPVNAAEATLTFDNSDKLLAIDTPEVHITRRVYRSGEGEYLINRQPCRLRDIRDLFAGTGAATEAYSVIEQGKVDVLLQSSPKDRRVIFEEAAGISRFKAKKVEATRRLERVDQNLLRLSDIVDEVENRLRNVRLQATKARRYKEHTDRLQSLRTQVGLADWRALGQQLHSVETALAALHDERDQSTAALEAGEAQSLEIETALSTLDESLRQCEAQIARNRERIATHESSIDHQRSRLHDLEEEIGRHRRHLATMSTRAGNLEQQARQTGEALAAAQIQFDQAQSRLAADEQVFSEVSARLAAVRESIAAMRATHMDRMRSAAMLGNQITGLESQESTAQRTSVLRGEQIEELGATQRQVSADLDLAREKLQTLEVSAAETAGQLKAQQTQLADGRRQLTKLQKELTQLEGRHTGATERAAVLEELDKRLEGLNAGVKEVLLKAREATDGPFEQVRGLVADLLQVNVETAPLIEIALGELAQHLVVAPGRALIEYLEAEPARFPGRVGFLRLDVQPPASAVDRVNLDGQAGVVGRADRFVEAPAEFLPLVRRLLGRTWIVEKLSNAVALSEGAGRGLNFVTLAGELLSAEGTLAVGPRHTSTGLISRRSELRALRGVIAELASKIEAHQTALAALERQVCETDERVQQLLSHHQEVSSALAQQQLQTRAADERLTELNARLATLEAELQSAVAQRDVAAAQLSSAKERLAKVEAEIADTEVRIQEAGEQLEQLETQRAQSSRQTTEERVGLARSEQQLDSLRRQMEQLTHDQQERSRALAESRLQMEQCIERAGQARQSILQAGAEVAELYLAKEQLTFDGLQRQLERDAKRLERTELGTQTQRIRHHVRTLEESIHAQDLVAGDLSHQRAALVQRLREDYDIELGELEHEPSAEEQREREAIEQEIADLRRKINNIGNVNLEALTELEELELRFGSLSAQHSDLTKAKGSLEQIIGRINSDSRRLFAETLEVVRGHFQALFRKLFGGGQADIVLEEGLDILDCGIEIVARPPGKEPRSISLLSGGEKTLTCVALLLAVFRSRPSPFCVLDEVDAALDEANIERFVSVVKDFLSWTQFIIVTHSKKTMTCASTLYGVTMQESGISKRVSVRFEDVSEDGRIHQSALDREKDDADASASSDETQAA